MDEQKELDLQVAREEEELADGELDLDEKDFWEDLTVFEEPAAEAAEKICIGNCSYRTTQMPFICISA